ncbi:MAG: recombinase family protein, partial [Clostridia bacterium]|nr:recombinase family protein [Clostridia bacterium]
MSKAKKAALYIRVSTNHQIDKDSLPVQRKDLINYAEVMLGISDYEIFEDAGYSGKNVERPAYQDMMRRCRQGEFSHILVWKIDRISRNLVDFASMYEELK